MFAAREGSMDLGGERRVNIYVTRAQCLTSLNSNMIEVSITEIDNLRRLKTERNFRCDKMTKR